jgi:hypothetical protein
MAPASSLGPAVLIRTALSPTKLARVAQASYGPSPSPLPELSGAAPDVATVPGVYICGWWMNRTSFGPPGPKRAV